MTIDPEESARKLLEVVPITMQDIRSEMRRRRTIDLTVPQFRALAFVNRIKQSNSPTKIILGGPQATFLGRDRLERSAADTPSSEAKGSTRCWTLRTRSNHAARVTLTAPRKEMKIPSSRIPIGN
jgi:hypothetical protein